MRPELDAERRIDADRRLVEEDHLGLVDERACEREPAAHPAGELQRRRPLPVVQLHQFEDPVDRTAVAAAQEAREEPEVLADGQIRIERLGLGHVADPREHRARRHPGAQDPCLAARRPGEPGEHADQRRLARAIRA